MCGGGGRGTYAEYTKKANVDKKGRHSPISRKGSWVGWRLRQSWQPRVLELLSLGQSETPLDHRRGPQMETTDWGQRKCSRVRDSPALPSWGSSPAPTPSTCTLSVRLPAGRLPPPEGAVSAYAGRASPWCLFPALSPPGPAPQAGRTPSRGFWSPGNAADGVALQTPPASAWLLQGQGLCPEGLSSGVKSPLSQRSAPLVQASEAGHQGSATSVRGHQAEAPKTPALGSCSESLAGAHL